MAARMVHLVRPLARPPLCPQLLMLTSDVFGSFDVEEDRLHVFHTHALWAEGAAHEETSDGREQKKNTNEDAVRETKSDFGSDRSHRTALQAAPTCRAALRCATLR